VILSVAASAADPHTTNNTAEPIAGLSAAVTLPAAGSLACWVTVEAEPKSVNWEYLGLRFLLDGVPGEWWLQKKDGNPSASPRYLLNAHTVFAAAAGSHVVQVQWWDGGGSNLDATFYTRRLTVIADSGALPGGEEPPPSPPTPPPAHPAGTLGPLVAALGPGDTLTLTGTYVDDLDLRAAPGNVSVVGPASVRQVLVDGPVVVGLRDLTMTRLVASRGAWLQMAGAIRVEGWTGSSAFLPGFPSGVLCYGDVQIDWVADGSFSVIGAGSGWGLHLVGNSRWLNFDHAVTVLADGCAIGHQLGFHGVFTNQGPGSSTTLEDCALGVQATDCSSWSTNRPLTYRRCPAQHDANSMSWYVTPEWMAALAVAFTSNIVALVWNASRVNSTVGRLTDSVGMLDRTLDKLAESLTVESRINAVQDTRLESHTKRLDPRRGHL
jgi:hypothetical protein